MKSFFLCLALIVLLSNPAFAEVKLSDVHAFETSQGMKNGAVLMGIENATDKADRLISASTPVADATEIHEMKEENGVMKMREVGAIPLKAGENVILNPEGYHIMLLGLKAPLQSGKAFPIMLKFENGGEILTTVKVRIRGAKLIPPSKDGMDMDHNMKHMDMAH